MAQSPARPFHTVLVANRGEIACRVLRSAKALGYRTVAVYSEADAESPHVAQADLAVCIGPPPAVRSYLSTERILEAASRTGADAVHPGYGFLSENAAFAKACAEAGLVFVGPSAESIELMGNKRAAKARVEAAGVPLLPGYHGETQDDAALLAEAERIGFPLMVKAAAGGGGRGLRRVEDAEALAGALGSARSEAANAFGSGELLLEKALDGARHVEVQVLADSHGATLHLGERECSLQRRHQKVIEEAPSPAVSPELRGRMGEAAVAAARAVDYQGAGTVEFLLAPDGAFHFMEMNTRLQVEHPVTEAVTGLDLVAWQFRIAAGEALDFAQEDVRLSGHAIEARLYAEDARKGFLPRTGHVLAWRPATGESLRTDHALAEGLEVTAFYDPMLGKVIVHGRNREEARRRLLRALDDTVLLGPTTNKSFLMDLLRHPDVAAGNAATDFITTQFMPWHPEPPDPDPLAPLAAVLLAVVDGAAHGNGFATLAVPVAGSQAGTPGAGRWRLHPRPIHIALEHAGGITPWLVTEVAAGCWQATYEGDARGQGALTHDVRLLDIDGARLRFIVDGVAATAHYARDGARLMLDHGGRCETFTEQQPELGRGQDDSARSEIHAPIAGKVLQVRARTGVAVKQGDTLVVIEAMKMEHEITATISGTVAEVPITEGDQVTNRQVLVRMTPPKKT